MKVKKLKKYVVELDDILLHSEEDVKLIVLISSRLEQIAKKGCNKELKGFIKTLGKMRDCSESGSDYKFLEKVIYRLKEMI